MLRVAGLPAGSSAVLVVESDAEVVRTTDPRCTYAKARATCQVSGADLSPVTFEVVAPQGARVTASLTPAAAGRRRRQQHLARRPRLSRPRRGTPPDGAPSPRIV